jgi:SPP1 family predicted phage head-tail adaptor
MPAGRCDTTLEIQENKPRRLASGELEPRWEKLRTALFEIEPESGSEVTRGVQLEATVTHRLKCRYFEGASPQLRLVGGDRHFHVVSVFDEEGRRQWLIWKCTEVR